MLFEALLLSVLASDAAARSPAPQSPPSAPPARGAPVAEGLEVASGLEARVWADSPQLYNPTAIDIDPEGRVWVAEAVNYRRWNGRNPGRHHERGDRIVVLEDEDGDGACDASHVFAQDADLVAPLGILWMDRSVLVSCSPTAWLYHDDDGDRVADRKEAFLTGFGGRDHDHGLHSFVLGPDGKLYVAVGNAGPHIVKDRAGWTLRSGSIYRGGGEHETDNAPGLVSADGRVWTGGLILRCERDGSGLEVVAHNFRNPYEVALDSYGRMYTADNDDDGNAGCRTTWVVEGGNYGFFASDGARTWESDRRPWQSTWNAHWHLDDPGVMPAGTNNGPGGPTGVCTTDGGLGGSLLTPQVLDCDAGARIVYTHTRGPFEDPRELARGWLVRAPQHTDDATPLSARWFRPSDVCIGPDGSVFVADWQDPGVGGHLAGDAEARGRILRIAPHGTDLPARAARPTTVAEAVAGLQSPCASIQLVARTLLELDPAAARLVLAGPEGLGSRHGPTRNRALWAAATLPGATPAVVRDACASYESGLRGPLVRAFVARVLRGAGLFDEALRTGWSRLSAQERIEGLLALPVLPHDDALALWKRAAFDSPSELRERHVLEALGLAWERLGSPDLGATWDKELADPRSSAWRVAWRLHPPQLVPRFAARASDATLPLELRREALEAIAFVPGREAGEAMLQLALAAPQDLRALAEWWIERNDAALWHGLGLAAELGPRGLAGTQPLYESELVHAHTVDIDVPLDGASELWLLTGPGTNGNGCDWSEWIEPIVETDAGPVPLAQLPRTVSEVGWGTLGIDRNSVGGPLTIDDQVFVHGIAAHAPSRLAFALPAGARRFRARAGLDDAGTRQPNCQAEVQFFVHARIPEDPALLHAVEQPLVQQGAAADAIEAAAVSLCADPRAGMRLVNLALRDELTPAGRAAVARHIFQHPDLAVRTLAAAHFERPNAAARLVPSEILALSGSRRRGEALFSSQRAACSTCHAFQGRGASIGPDLGSVRTKYAREQILDALLNPSASIAFGYDSWLVQTKSGAVHAGFLLSRSPVLVLKETSGTRIAIEADEVELARKLSTSAMPSDVALGLEPQELADLVAFLTSDPQAAGKRGTPIELYNGKDLSGWSCYLTDPQLALGDVWTVRDGVLRCRGTPAGYLKSERRFESFELVVEWRFDPLAGPGNSGVLLRRVGDDKIWPKSIEAQLLHRNAGDIWNIDAFPLQVDERRTDGRRTEKQKPSNEKPLGEWNRYEIVLDGGNLSLTVNGELQNSARWCEELPGEICLQSEGAVIEFRKVTLTPITRD
jgi:putative membrane-bound dehydrogenase-like protein